MYGPAGVPRWRRIVADVLMLAGIVGVVLGTWGIIEGREAQSDLRDYVREQAGQTDLALYRGCLIGNTDVRPGVRTLAVVLNTLVGEANASATRAGHAPTPGFASAPRRLGEVIAQLGPRDCGSLYPEGRDLFNLARGG